MERVKVNLKTAPVDRSYDIHIGGGVLAQIGSLIPKKNYSKFAIVLDEVLKGAAYIQNLIQSLQAAFKTEAHIVEIKSAEKSKTVEGLSKAWQGFQAAGLDRKSLVIAIGGGAILDLAGFAASTYMRGIDFVHVPTTLLSQVDASIGGKVGINFSEVKNLVGNFAQPQTVIIDVDTLTSLPKREFTSGIAEIVKHGLIKSADYLSSFQDTVLSQNDKAKLMKVILGSCEIKAEVVSSDEHETGLRKILNFGHTIGHAFESLSHQGKSPLLHGEAVSLGMVVEAEISKLQGLIAQKDVDFVRKTLETQGLPIRLQEVYDKEALMKKVRSDKKNVDSKIKWTLLKSIGEAVFDIEVENALVESALEAIYVKKNL